MKEEIEFVNGFTSWYETFYEIVDYITYSFYTDIGETCRSLKDIQDEFGRNGLYELARTLTNKFELQYQGKEWDGDYFDTIDNFLEEELK